MGRHGTIAGRKAAQDAKRAANFTKYARVITIAAKAGGDPDYNVALKHAIERAKGINMPNDKIQKAIKKGTGELLSLIHICRADGGKISDGKSRHIDRAHS